MSRIADGMRVSLAERAEELQHLLDVGIEDPDWYRNACECFVLLNSIDDNERTPEEMSQRKRLLELTDAYESIWYRYGN